jgi:NitT/TauT family transport system ATP-binding protein
MQQAPNNHVSSSVDPPKMIMARNVSKIYASRSGPVEALSAVDFSLDRGEFVALLGPSGCGKSTLLNMIAGLIQPTGGQVEYDGQLLTGVNTSIGYMTQHDGILPWLTVWQNIELPLIVRHISKYERQARVRKYIDLVHLQGFDNSYPVQLSGGMRKRVGLAQALVYEPETLLLDEPFAALDALLRMRLHAELLEIVNRLNMSTLLVTHDMDEAIILSDRVAVMSARPATIAVEINVGIDRLSRGSDIQSTDEYVEIRRQVWDALSPQIDRN